MTRPARAERPPWLRVRAPFGGKMARVTEVLGKHGLVTVCREARCPNVGECWGEGTATVLILGDSCTRGCSFCNVTPGIPPPPDPTEPSRVAATAAELSWRHVVVTSVTRDDLPDGGAEQFVRTVALLRALSPPPSVELLVPDFRGDAAALGRVVEARPDVLAHNVETVPRLYPSVRPGAVYGRSLELLSRACRMDPRLMVKSGLMVGLGESRDEVAAVLEDLYGTGCRSVTLGQYLPPSQAHLPVREYLTPALFRELEEEARGIGFLRVASGPLVRSSYRAAGGKRAGGEDG